MTLNSQIYFSITKLCLQYFILFSQIRILVKEILRRCLYLVDLFLTKF
nr:MAG TPA: hypothetical protein [Caudoviricetes sp.]